MFADMRVKDTAELLSSSFDGKFEVGHVPDDHGVTGGLGDGAGGEAGTGGVDPSRLPPAQRQLFMRIQQKQHRDEINSKPISEITTKCE